MRRKLVAGNWKMHGRQGENAHLIDGVLTGLATINNVDVMVAPPTIYLQQVAQLLAGSKVKLAAQNLATEEQGAFTGEVSGVMLADIGVNAVIIGHSERRALYGETDAVVVEKTTRALSANLTPIICIGETLDEREAGSTLTVVSRQLRAVLDVFSAEDIARCVVAYEPVWAIGTGKTASPEQAQEVHAALRQLVATYSAEVASGLTILYGGSVKASNAQSLFAKSDIDGALVGGASLMAQEFIAICEAAALAN